MRKAKRASEAHLVQGVPWKADTPRPPRHHLQVSRHLVVYEEVRRYSPLGRRWSHLMDGSWVGFDQWVVHLMRVGGVQQSPSRNFHTWEEWRSRSYVIRRMARVGEGIVPSDATKVTWFTGVKRREGRKGCCWRCCHFVCWNPLINKSSWTYLLGAYLGWWSLGSHLTDRRPKWGNSQVDTDIGTILHAVLHHRFSCKHFWHENKALEEPSNDLLSSPNVVHFFPHGVLSDFCASYQAPV